MAGGYSPDVVGGAALHPLSLGSSQGRGGITLFSLGDPVVLGPKAGCSYDH